MLLFCVPQYERLFMHADIQMLRGNVTKQND